MAGLLVNESRLFQKGGENYIAKPTSISAKSHEQLAGVCYSTEKPPGATLGFCWVLLYCVVRNIRLRTDLSHNLSQVQRRLTDQSQLSLTANTRISLSQGNQERKKKGENVFDWHRFVQLQNKIPTSFGSLCRSVSIVDSQDIAFKKGR